MQLRMAKWAYARKGFSYLNIDNIMESCGACLKIGAIKKKRKVSWISPSYGVLKFNVDGAARGKPGWRALEGF